MSFGIIIRGEGNSKRFKPHMNHAIGKYIHTKDDYLKGMKEHGLIPQEEARKIADSKRKEMSKPYKSSKWAHEMVEARKRSGGNPGGAYYDELAKKGYGKKKLNQMKDAAAKAEKWTRSGQSGFAQD